MIIEKKYYFHAAHRNLDLLDRCPKCAAIHGHCFHIVCYFEGEQTTSVSLIFSDIDDEMKKIIKGKYDHSLMLERKDPLTETLLKIPPQKLILFEVPPSVENLCMALFKEIYATGLPIVQVDVQETETSIIKFKPSSAWMFWTAPSVSIPELVLV